MAHAARAAAKRPLVHAQLRLEIAQETLLLTSEGPDLRLTYSDTSAVGSELIGFVRAMAPVRGQRLSALSRSLGAFADQLADAGQRLTVTSGRGDILVLGRGEHSRIALLLTGSRHVGVANVRTALVEMRGALRTRSVGSP